MKSFIVLSLIVAFMAVAYFINQWLQKIIKPRQSLGRLLFYFLVVLIVIFIFTFLMVLVIGQLYPGELIK